MLYKTHIVTSLTLGAGISLLSNYPFSFPYVVGITIGSLLPDIDEPNSFIGRRSLGISYVINRKYGHRGMTHGLFAWLILTIVCLIYPIPLTMGISLGYLFHLLGDFFSKSSIPIFTPFNNDKPRLKFSYRTGSQTESIIYIIFYFILFFIFVYGNLYKALVDSTVEFTISFIKILFKLLQYFNS